MLPAGPMVMTAVGSAEIGCSVIQVPCEQLGSSYGARISESNGPYEDNADLAYWIKGDILRLAQGS